VDCARTKVHSVGVKDFSNVISQIASLKADLCFWEDAAEDAASLRDSLQGGNLSGPAALPASASASAYTVKPRYTVQLGSRGFERYAV